ncbi:uncharacterized protein LOC143244546 [Tachypleus tridentatus]|uniref:uncharacterized protein LOC143244546 n=1 Tax=Tachypleus tridentatus TaxID=6853 RepID=UPI003FD41FA4
MTSIRLNNNLSPSRKVVSDNCLKKLSLKSLPALLRSLSNQNNRKIQKQSAGNHCRMRPSSTSNLPCSNSDVITHQHSPGYSTELKSSSPRELLRVSHRLDWMPDGYDDNSEVKRGARDQSITQQAVAEVKLTNSIFQPDNSKAVTVNEKVPPVQHKE